MNPIHSMACMMWTDLAHDPIILLSHSTLVLATCYVTFLLVNVKWLLHVYVHVMFVSHVSYRSMFVS